jgi:ABC-type nickel/cobalt efflux system permease component RcnA
MIGLLLSLSHALAPERVYPWLGTASGLLLIVIGAAMVRARLHRRHHHDHEHAAPISRRGLLAMGFAGGLVPSPSALVVLLGAIALGRLWFGIVLIAAYGVGMGATLAGAGLLLVRARGRLERARGTRWKRLATVVPALAAFVVLALGILTALRGISRI